jgi:histidine triad (HIT) family protein
MPSIFSLIVKGDIPCYKIAENDDFLAFLDINPVAKGHCLVIPKTEIDYIFDLEDAHLSSMMVFAKQVAKGIEKVVPCARIGITVIGLEIPHAHIHLIPINGLFDMDFTKEKLQFSKEDFESLASEISSEIS